MESRWLGANRGSNHKMKEIQGRWLRGWDEDQAEESSDWPKEWLFNVQSSSTEPKSDSLVSKVVQQITLSDRSSTMEQGYPQATPE
jgi:hypothetical protein